MHLLISWHEYVQQCYDAYAYVTLWSTSWPKSVHKWHLALVCSRPFSSCTPKRKHMTLAIIILKNILPFAYWNTKTFFSSIPPCYSKWTTWIFFYLKKLLVLMTRIILAMSGHDTLRPSSLGPSQILYMILRATSHTRWGPVTIALQALSLVERSELVHVHFTLWLRDQQSKWMQDGCKIYMDSYMASNGSGFKIT